MSETKVAGNARPFMTLDAFNALVETGEYAAIRRTTLDIVTRWQWLARGNVELPFYPGNADYIDNARQYIQAAEGQPIPAFPFSPRDYPRTRAEQFSFLPENLRMEMIYPGEENEAAWWLV